MKKTITIPEISSDEVLVKSLYGCLEGNFIHALQSKPINLIKYRDEENIVLGNSGVVQIEQVGENVKEVTVGDICIYFCNGEEDRFGYPIKISAYDKPNSMGVFSKRLKLNKKEVIKIPDQSKISLSQWAGFSLKYITAWSNWNVAYNCWKSQMSDVSPEDTYVFAWGGGVSLAELSLAKIYGCKSYLITSKEERISMAKSMGIDGFDRSEGENALLNYIEQETDGLGASIFIDNIGQSVYKTTMKALGRQGVLTTSGWKTGGMLPISRANECQNRHIHVHTHYASYSEGVTAIEFAEKHNWVPPVSKKEYSWDDLPQILEDYQNGEITEYFPIFKIEEKDEIF